VTGAVAIRPGRDGDAEGFIALIGAAWAEYPGCVLDLDGEVPELRALATHFDKADGALWAAERGGAVVGMIGTRPLPEPGSAWEICRLYLAAGQRGTGLAQRLLRLAEDHARAQGAARLVLWTDTRFDRAHRFYEKQGYVRQGAIRALGDSSNTLEFRYAKPASGLVVETLDAAAAASAERRLSDILLACVEAGHGGPFLPPLPPAEARAFWRQVASDAASGRLVLLAAWSEGALTGTVQLDLHTPQNQPHRAEVSTLLVEPTAWRRGVGRALLRRAEEVAAGIGRPLLTLETLAGDPAEALCRSLDWREVGRIRRGARRADGTLADVLGFWRWAGPCPDQG
jgi:GNAT superfamily N-acetyltransferase